MEERNLKLAHFAECIKKEFLFLVTTHLTQFGAKGICLSLFFCFSRSWQALRSVPHPHLSAAVYRERRGDGSWWMRRRGCQPLNPLSFSERGVGGEESHHLGWRQTRKERKNKHFNLSGGPVWWLLLAQVWPSHSRMIAFTELSMAGLTGSKGNRYKELENFFRIQSAEGSSVFMLVIFQGGQVVEERNSLYTATESFTPPGDYNQAPTCLKLLRKIRIIH